MTKGHRNFLVLAVSALAFVSSAHASTFNVNPIRLHLAEDGSSALLTIHNTSDEEIRFQLTTYAWTQSADGEIELGATDDIIFFPRMMKLAPGAKRKVRIGQTKKPSKSAAPAPQTASGENVETREKTYRILVEELPSRKTKKDAEQIQVLTRMSIPIFVDPPKPEVKLGVANASLKQGRFRFDLKNSGTVHTMLNKVRVTAVGAGNRDLFSRDLAGWYILAAGIRTYEVEVPKSVCRKISHFEITGSTAENDSAVSLRHEVPPDACAAQ